MKAGAIIVGLLPLGGGGVDAGLLPEEEDFRQQFIVKQAGETDWPFASSSGILSCVPGMGDRMVFFVPDDGSMDLDGNDDGTRGLPRALVVSVNPFDQILNWGQDRHFVPGMSIEDKIKRLGPYVSLGKKLCDQPGGSVVGPGEL